MNRTLCRIRTAVWNLLLLLAILAKHLCRTKVVWVNTLVFRLAQIRNRCVVAETKANWVAIGRLLGPDPWYLRAYYWLDETLFDFCRLLFMGPVEYWTKAHYLVAVSIGVAVLWAYWTS